VERERNEAAEQPRAETIGRIGQKRGARTYRWGGEVGGEGHFWIEIILDGKRRSKSPFWTDMGLRKPKRIELAKRRKSGKSPSREKAANYLGNLGGWRGTKALARKKDQKETREYERDKGKKGTKTQKDTLSIIYMAKASADKASVQPGETKGIRTIGKSFIPKHTCQKGTGFGTGFTKRSSVGKSLGVFQLEREDRKPGGKNALRVELKEKKRPFVGGSLHKGGGRLVGEEKKKTKNFWRGPRIQSSKENSRTAV